MAFERLEKQGNTPKDRFSIHQVRILGQTLRIRSDKEAEDLQELIDFIEKKYREREEISSFQKLLMVTLEIADELIQERKRNQEWEERLDSLLALFPE